MSEAKIELLAPGGEVAAVKAAILAGADAVYCGLGKFNARQRAENITMPQLKGLIELAHSLNVKIYLTFNTLFLTSEMHEAAELLDDIVHLGIDAVIVQDYGLLRLIQENYPSLEVHASTQLTIHNEGQLDFLKRFGVTQVNFSREMALPEIKTLALYAHNLNLVVEVFVHGAYCVSFSGQCYMSSALTGHAGNRGSCVQTCRRQYQTEVGEVRPFNLKDNSAFELLSELIEVGVDSLKIEGRIKGVPYVYTTVSTWRKGITEHFKQNKVDGSALFTVFNRGLSDGYLRGQIERTMMTQQSKDDSLKEVGVIRQYSADVKELTLMHACAMQVGEELQIFTVNKEFIAKGKVTSIQHNRFGYKIEDKLHGMIKHGQVVYKNLSTIPLKDLDDKISAMKPTKNKLDIRLFGNVGEPLSAEFTLGVKNCLVHTDKKLMAPLKRPVTLETITEKLSKLGDTTLEIGEITAKGLATDIFIPIGEVNALRRAAVEQLIPSEEKHVTIIPELSLQTLEPYTEKILLVVDDEALIPRNLDGIECAFEVPSEIAPQKEELLALFARHPEVTPWFAAVILAENFGDSVDFITELAPSKIFTDNSGIAQVAAEKSIPWEAGALFNICNSYTLSALKQEGAVGAVISNELSREQLESAVAVSGMESRYALIAPQFLLASRSCLIRSSADCGKDVMDAHCLTSCNRDSFMVDEHKEKILVTKNPGEYNRMYAQKRFFSPDATRDFSGHFTSFLIDLREGTRTIPVKGDMDELVTKIKGLIAGDQEMVREITQHIGGWNNKQYYAGLL